MTNPKTWELYAVKYATSINRIRNDNFLNTDPHDSTPMPLDYFIWVAICEDQKIVIDTGFDEIEASARGRNIQRSITESLSLIQIDAKKVKDVIVTHLHYDHIGGHAEFPTAKFHIQESEMQFATGPHMCSDDMKHPFSVEHITSMVKNVFEGRVTFYDGVGQVAPGITVHHVGGHTMGLQFVRVLTKRGYVVLASDTSHFYENMDQVNPFPIIFNVDDMIRGYQSLREHAETDNHIIPGHDPIVLDIYPTPNEKLSGIVAKLDIEPNPHNHSSANLNQK
jgi:glyoxylase-like metal-dependent hydrolase (beta-lactamase superfamily II)